jgi:hypothetical protein
MRAEDLLYKDYWWISVRRATGGLVVEELLVDPIAPACDMFHYTGIQAVKRGLRTRKLSHPLPRDGAKAACRAWWCHETVRRPRVVLGGVIGVSRTGDCTAIVRGTGGVMEAFPARASLTGPQSSTRPLPPPPLAPPLPIHLSLDPPRRCLSQNPNLTVVPPRRLPRPSEMTPCAPCETHRRSSRRDAHRELSSHLLLGDVCAWKSSRPKLGDETTVDGNQPVDLSQQALEKVLVLILFTNEQRVRFGKAHRGEDVVDLQGVCNPSCHLRIHVIIFEIESGERLFVFQCLSYRHEGGR